MVITPRIITPAPSSGAPKPRSIVDLPHEAPPNMRPRIIQSTTEDTPATPAPQGRRIVSTEPQAAPVPAPKGRTLNVPERDDPPAPSFAPRRIDATPVSDAVDQMNGLMGRLVPNASPPVSTAAPVFAAPPRAPDRVDALAARAIEIDPVTGASPRIRPKIREVLDTPVSEWTNWGSDDLRVNAIITDDQVKAAQEYASTRIKNWIADTKEAASKPLGFLDRLTAKAKPGYYEQQLTGARDRCAALLPKIGGTLSTIKPKVENLQLHCVAMQVAAESLTDATQQMMASNRMRTLLAGAQTALIAMTSLEQLQLQIGQDVGDADMLLTSVIPNWKAAVSRA